MHDPHAENDINNLRELVDAHRESRPPKDVVPKHLPADTPPLPTGNQQLTVTEFDENGVTTTTTTAYIAPAIYPKGRSHD